MLSPANSGTDVDWRMTGEHKGLSGVIFGRLISIDRLVGGDFEKGLSQLKKVAES